jgi:predicted extracellular nuclease
VFVSPPVRHSSARQLLTISVIASLLAGLLIGLLPTSPTRALTSVFINEIHYDNTGTDAGEAIEVAGPAGTDLTGWSIVLYNGAGGAVYDTDALSGTIPNLQNGMGVVTLSYPVNGIQNGSPDGIALVNGGTVVQFLSYEGAFTAVGGAANGMLSTDIGVSETGSEPIGQSLQLTGSGNTYESFAWASPVTATFGAANTGQTFSAAALPVATCGATLFGASGFPATRTVTGRDPDGVVTSLTIDSVTPDPGTITIGATTPAGGVNGTASATVTAGAATPVGSYVVLVRATNNDTTPQSGTCSLTVEVGNVLTIGQVQGSVANTDDGLTYRSSFAPPSGNGTGQAVLIRGVVTQKFLSRTSSGASSYGIFVQNTPATADADPNSSDGIFVFMGSFADILRLYGGPAYLPTVGDEVVLRGNIVEFFSLTELSSPRLVAIPSTGLDPDTATPAVEAAPPDDLADANRFWERGEGMRFHVDADSRVVAARDVFPSTADGEVWVIRGDHPIANRADPYDRLVYRDPHPRDDVGPAGSFDNGNGMRILLTSHGLKAISADNTTLIDPARTYDTITNALTGALYFAFNKYSVEVEQQPVLVNGVDPALNDPPSTAVDGVEFATSDYNVENLYDRRDDPFDGCDFTGNPGCPGVVPPFDYVPVSAAVYQAHLADLAEQIAGPMHAPDLLMIQEAEDQDICTVTAGAMDCGATNNRDGKPDTLQELALAILTAGGPAYDTAYDRNGADDRGIVSAFLFRIDTVELLPADADDVVLGGAPTIDYRGTPLAYNTDVSNPKAVNADLPDDVELDTGFDGTNVFTRPPQVGHFRIWRDGIGTSVFTDLYAISNHFSSTPDARVGQRTEQAAYNAAIIEALFDAGATRVISGGDFNVYPRPDDPFAPGQAYACNPLPCAVGPSDQLGPMYDAGLHNLWDTLVAQVPRSAYSYNFVGQIQTLDMQFATDGQFDDLVQVRAAHLNADFAADYDGDVARGASDHDPQVARWFTDVTTDRLRALVGYFVETGDVVEAKADLLLARLDKADRFLSRGQEDAYLEQLAAFGDQAQELVPAFVSSAAAEVLEAEADRLASQLP